MLTPRSFLKILKKQKIRQNCKKSQKIINLKEREEKKLFAEKRRINAFFLDL